MVDMDILNDFSKHLMAYSVENSQPQMMREGAYYPFKISLQNQDIKPQTKTPK